MVGVAGDYCLPVQCGESVQDETGAAGEVGAVEMVREEGAVRRGHAGAGLGLVRRSVEVLADVAAMRQVITGAGYLLVAVFILLAAALPPYRRDRLNWSGRRVPDGLGTSFGRTIPLFSLTILRIG